MKKSKFLVGDKVVFYGINTIIKDVKWNGKINLYETEARPGYLYFESQINKRNGGK